MRHVAGASSVNLHHETPVGGEVQLHGARRRRVHVRRLVFRAADTLGIRPLPAMRHQIEIAAGAWVDADHGAKASKLEGKSSSAGACGTSAQLARRPTPRTNPGQ